VACRPALFCRGRNTTSRDRDAVPLYRRCPRHVSIFRCVGQNPPRSETRSSRFSGQGICISGVCLHVGPPSGPGGGFLIGRVLGRSCVWGGCSERAVRLRCCSLCAQTVGLLWLPVLRQLLPRARWSVGVFQVSFFGRFPAFPGRLSSRAAQPLGEGLRLVESYLFCLPGHAGKLKHHRTQGACGRIRDTSKKCKRVAR